MKEFDPDFIGRWVVISAHRVAHIITKSMRVNNIPLTHEQLIILKIISVDEGISQKRLAYRLDRDKTSIARSIGILKKNKLVDIKINKLDKRVNFLYLTDESKALLKKLTPIFEELQSNILDGFSDEDVNRSVMFLKKITERITELESNM